MLLELCVTELEDVATDSQSGRLSSQPVVVESSHPYTDDTSTSGTVKIPGEREEVVSLEAGSSPVWVVDEPIFLGLGFCGLGFITSHRCVLVRGGAGRPLTSETLNPKLLSRRCAAAAHCF